MPYHFLSRTPATLGFLMQAIEEEAAAEAEADAKKAAAATKDADQAARIVEAVAPVGQSLLEILAGVPQKEERTAEALARAAEAQAAAAQARAMAARGQTESGPAGIPWLAWLAIGGAAVYFATRKG